MLRDHIIVGVHITNRVENAVAVQNVLTGFGTRIKTRIGLHETSSDCCGSPNGLVLVEFAGDEQSCREMTDKLTAIVGVEVKRMVFSHS